MWHFHHYGSHWQAIAPLARVAVLFSNLHDHYGAGVAGLTITLGSMALEQSQFAPLGTQSIVGYLNGTHTLPVLWLAVVPGILGHQVHQFCPDSHYPVARRQH